MGWLLGSKIRMLQKGKPAFWCPACRCAHYVYLVEYNDLNDTRMPTWRFNGNGERPTFSPSVNVNASHPESRCHSWVEDGKITYVSDSFHNFKGQTVEIPDWPAGDDDDDDWQADLPER